MSMQEKRMDYDPGTGETRPYPSHAAQWRQDNPTVAWLVNPWTGRRRDAEDVGPDVFGLLICPLGVPPFGERPLAAPALPDTTTGGGRG